MESPWPAGRKPRVFKRKEDIFAAHHGACLPAPRRPLVGGDRKGKYILVSSRGITGDVPEGDCG